jgi:hypothetical protein
MRMGQGRTLLRHAVLAYQIARSTCDVCSARALPAPSNGKAIKDSANLADRVHVQST